MVQANDLYSAISQAIAPLLGRDVLNMTSCSAAYVIFLERILPSVSGESRFELTLGQQSADQMAIA